ncbi:MAG: hypothetical protein RML12_11400 [Xanthomonadales bacterium]|nr:hypothetical protein [Xanthomonadales bacterium]
MAVSLLALVVALGLAYLAPELTRLRRYDWLSAWIGLLSRLPAWRERLGGELALLLALAGPLLPLALLLWLLAQPWHGLLAFLAAIALLFYAWGPRDLDRDCEAIAAAGEGPAREAALRALLPNPAESGTDWTREGAVAALALAALRRWFGTLLWFLLLGALGAVLYRLVQILAEVEPADRLPAEVRAAARRLLALLDWPAATLVALSLALVSDFDAVIAAWRRALAQAGGLLALDRAPLVAAMLAAVPAESEGEAGDEALTRAVAAGRRRLWRVLLLWLAVIALAVLSGYAG